MSTHRTRRARAAALLAAATTVAASLAACSSDDDGGGGDSASKSITVWIEEDLPDRVAATQAIVDAFTKESGIKVKLVAVAEDQFNQILTSNAAAGDLPDVMGGIPLGQIRTLSGNELIDTDAVSEVLDDLGTDTFSESALDLTADGDTALAVPSESWVQLLLYRKDLFDQAGLAAPQTYDDVLAAAKALDSGDVAGFVGANVAGDAFTEQTMEEIGLGNDCQLVDEEGEVTFDSDQCVEALDFYGQLMQNYTVSGAQDVDTTRASYFAGQAAMIIWSTFILY
jgi:multiple sugar transport system substrate-binding protein